MKPSTLYETQKTFRILMNSMASPGELFCTDQTEDMLPLTIRICETLIDHEVSFSVVGEKVEETFINEIAFRTGAEYVDATQAMYVIVCGGSSAGAIQNLNPGTLEYPERGATVIYMVDNLAATGGVPLLLSGPGIKEPFITTIDGVAKDEFKLLQQINSEYPLGIDAIFCDEKQVLSLPRTTSVVFQEKE